MLGICGHRVATYGAWLLIAGALLGCGQTPPTGVQPQASANVEPSPASTVRSPALGAKQWRTFRNEEFRYSIQIPPDWIVDDDDKNEVIIFIGRSNGLAGLHILAFDWTSTFDEFVRDNHRFHRRRAAVLFEPLSSTQVEMATGPTARRVEYRVQNDFRFCIELLVDYLLVAGNLSYALQGSICEGAEELYGADIDTMQRSFRLDSDLAMVPADPYSRSGIK